MGPYDHAVSSRVYIQSVLRCRPPSRKACLVMFKQILVFNFLGCFKDCNKSRKGKHDCQKRSVKKDLVFTLL